MCAINGITTNNKELVERMNERTKHRGPDGSCVWEGRGVTFGHNRLAIIDLSESASQPMTDNSGRYTIVFNGEIYNYRELREELRHTYEFKTESDTEVLLAAYVKWGTDVFPRLRGIFAFAIWDAKDSALVLARDHMGVKPLYYSHENSVLSFSSEMPALLLAQKERTLDTSALAFYLSMEYVPSPRTLVRGITKLPAGHVLTYRDGSIFTRSFVNSDKNVKDIPHGTIYETIDAAVKRQLVSDRPVGAYLSGGFDSSIVVHHMAKHTPHTRTYSVDFESVQGQEGESVKFNADARLAERTAAFFGTKHTTYTITLENVRNTIETASTLANEPVANSTATTQYLLSDFVRKDGTVVVLGGDGGDELFGGYTRHRIAMGAYLYQQLPHFMQTVGARMSPRIAKLSTPFGTPFHRALMVKDEKKIMPFLKKNIGINATVTNFFDEEYGHESTQGIHPLHTFMRVDRRTWLPDECFIRSDYASMAHGVELRVPFVDTDVVALSDKISVWKKTLPHEGKRIIREVYKPYLPKHLYNQPKRGWLSPAAKWFRDPKIYALAQQVFSSDYYDGLSDVFDWERVRAHLDEHVAKQGYHLYPLWNIMVLQIWARENKVNSK